MIAVVSQFLCGSVLYLGMGVKFAIVICYSDVLADPEIMDIPGSPLFTYMSSLTPAALHGEERSEELLLRSC